MLGSKISNAPENKFFSFFYAFQVKKGMYLEVGESKVGIALQGSSQDYVLSWGLVPPPRRVISSGISKVCFPRCTGTMNRAGLKAFFHWRSCRPGAWLPRTCPVRNLSSDHPGKLLSIEPLFSSTVLCLGIDFEHITEVLSSIFFFLMKPGQTTTSFRCGTQYWFYSTS